MKPTIDGDDAGGGTEDSTPDQTQDPLGETAGDTDDFGYAKPKGSGETPAPKSAEVPGKPEEPVSDFKSGYDEVDDKETPAAPVVEPTKEKGILDVNVDGLPDAEVKKLNEALGKVSVTKEAAQAFFDLRKAQLADQAKAQQDAVEAAKVKVAETKKAWGKELRDDPKFGGENYARNVKMTEKLISEFMWDTKKLLTERGGMLPPSTMRDLARLAERVYGVDAKPSGGPSVPDPEVANPDDELNEMYGWSPSKKA